MPLRDVALTVTILGLLPFCFVRPYVGILVWTWVSMMNPHKLTWGFAQEMPIALMVAVATLAGLLLTRDRRPIPRSREVALLLALWALFALTTAFALYPDEAWLYFKQVSKILLMVFVMIALVRDRTRLHQLMLVATLSVAFYGVKGGVWAITTGATSGLNRVYGPEGSFIQDNNALALALNMTLPLLWFLAQEEGRPWLRWILHASFGFSIIGILLTYSRGGFLGLIIILAALWWSVSWRLKIPLAACALVGGVALTWWFLPEHWFDRMESIVEYEGDSSAVARLKAWYVGWRLALDFPLLGGGFFAFSPDVFEDYLPSYGKWHSAHSIYFGVLGEHGFTGLGLYLALMLSTFVSLARIRRTATRIRGAWWLVNYARMVQVALVGFAVTGLFLNLTYFDYYFLLVGVTIILKQLLKETERERTLERQVRVPSARDVRLATAR